jgi:hypothetical protein
MPTRVCNKKQKANNMAKPLLPYIDLESPETSTAPQNTAKSESANDGTKDKEKAEKLTKTASFTIPVYLKDWLQSHADQMTSNKSIEGRWTSSKLVTQMIKEYKERMEVRT